MCELLTFNPEDLSSSPPHAAIAAWVHNNAEIDPTNPERLSSTQGTTDDVFRILVRHEKDEVAHTERSSAQDARGKQDSEVWLAPFPCLQCRMFST